MNTQHSYYSKIETLCHDNIIDGAHVNAITTLINSLKKSKCGYDYDYVIAEINSSKLKKNKESYIIIITNVEIPHSKKFVLSGFAFASFLKLLNDYDDIIYSQCELFIVNCSKKNIKFAEENTLKLLNGNFKLNDILFSNKTLFSILHYSEKTVAKIFEQTQYFELYKYIINSAHKRLINISVIKKFLNRECENISTNQVIKDIFAEIIRNNIVCTRTLFEYCCIFSSHEPYIILFINEKTKISNGCFENVLKWNPPCSTKRAKTINLFVNFGYKLTQPNILRLTRLKIIIENCDISTFDEKSLNDMQIICDDILMYPYGIKQTIVGFEKYIKSTNPSITDFIKYINNPFVGKLGTDHLKIICAHGHHKIVEYLVDTLKININMSCLHYLCSNNKYFTCEMIRTAKYIIEKGKLEPDMQCLNLIVSEEKIWLVDMIKNKYFVDPKDIVRTPPKNIAQTTQTDIVQDVPKDIVQTTPKDIVQDAPKDVVQDAQKDVVQDAQKDVVQTTPKDIVQDAPKDIVQDVPKDIVQTTPTDIVQTTPTDIVQTPPKDVVQTTPKKTQKKIQHDLSKNKKKCLWMTDDIK